MKHITIGIDTGVNTGFAVWDCVEKKFDRIDTLQLHNALFEVKCYFDSAEICIKKVRVEDARKWIFGHDSNKFKLQGVGSVKRDAKIWEDFLIDYNIPFEMVRPNKGITKWKSADFKARIGWSGVTTTHSRDAAMLVVNSR